MTRLLAFSFLVWAAFDGPTVWTDRAGCALIGLAFLALAAGRGSGRSRPAMFAPRPPAWMGAMPEVPPQAVTLAESDLVARVGAYSDDGRE